MNVRARDLRPEHVNRLVRLPGRARTRGYLHDVQHRADGTVMVFVRSDRNPADRSQVTAFHPPLRANDVVEFLD